MLKKTAEAVVNFTVIVMCVTALGVIGYAISQHVTCVDLFQKWCVVH